MWRGVPAERTVFLVADDRAERGADHDVPLPATVETVKGMLYVQSDFTVVLVCHAPPHGSLYERGRASPHKCKSAPPHGRHTQPRTTPPTRTCTASLTISSFMWHVFMRTRGKLPPCAASTMTAPGQAAGMAWIGGGPSSNAAFAASRAMRSMSAPSPAASWSASSAAIAAAFTTA